MTSGWVVVGLGNPGPGYAGHRHNVGYLVAEVLATRIGARFGAAKGMRAELADGRFGPVGPDSVKVTVVKPRTYMNETGGPV
ncbi:MAG: aminoacyl-tRNA hydrolase, partial [Microlunatus sp.]|nr:aminoacyl-tRNA hydrolase [Microlunatus sp.]